MRPKQYGNARRKKMRVNRDRILEIICPFKMNVIYCPKKHCKWDPDCKRLRECKNMFKDLMQLFSYAEETIEFLKEERQKLYNTLLKYKQTVVALPHDICATPNGDDVYIPKQDSLEYFINAVMKMQEISNISIEEIFAEVDGLEPDKHKNVLGDKKKYIKAVENKLKGVCCEQDSS